MVIYKAINGVGKVRRKDCSLFLVMRQVFCNAVKLFGLQLMKISGFMI